MMLFLTAPLLAKFALKFGGPEYFALGIFGLSIVTGVSSKSTLKGITGAAIGLAQISNVPDEILMPREIVHAHNLGADIVKLFPSGYLGFRYIKDILAPISHIKLCATGGVTEENWGEYLSLGFAGAGISGRLCDKKCITSGDFAEITRRAKVFSDMARVY